MVFVYPGPKPAIFFPIRETPTSRPTVLGTLREGLLSQQLMVSYFSDSAAPSEELRKSVAMGLNGEPR
ncbi:hypothetical protein JCM10212_003233 [Sporobolomyces blumeae]